METQKILEVAARYQKFFDEQHIPKVRMDSSRTFGSLTHQEALAHANYLLDGIREYAQVPGKEGKAGRHLGSLQTILSFLNVYTLEELMEHNRPSQK